MFVVIAVADENRSDERIPTDIVQGYRKWRESGKESKVKIETVIVFKKAEAREPLYSKNTVEELDSMFKPLTPIKS